MFQRHHRQYLARDTRNPLTNDELARIAPVVFQQNPSPSRSAAYSMVRTADVVDSLRTAGWVPVWAAQSLTRSEARDGYQKHMIRLRHPDFALKGVGDTVPELLIINSHDGASAYKLHAGLFRLVCANGMVISDGTFAQVSLKHIGLRQADVVDAAYQVISEVPKLSASVDGMRSTMLSLPERTTFAESALIARYGELKASPLEPVQVLQPRRYDDSATDLWTTLNVVQENLVRGGLSGRNPETMRRATVREVRGISQNVNLNKALWHLAENLKAARVAA